MPAIAIAVAVAVAAVAAVATAAPRRRGLTIAQIRALDPHTTTPAQLQAALITMIGPAFAARIDELEARIILDGIVFLYDALQVPELGQDQLAAIEADPRWAAARDVVETNFTQAEQDAILARGRRMGWLPRGL